jgi:hypothetical protein
MSTTVSTSIAGSAELKERIDRFQEVHRSIVREVHKAIVGQEEVIEQVLISLFVGGHCLITGLPGTAKTLLVRTLAQTLGLVFKRIQFTPDLMPSDITGTDIIEEDTATGHRTWTFVPGPIFSNVLLADEINRTPPKTQSALLEAMQELSCTVRGHQYKINAPFFVLATQNPIELEGTYPLPEAQLDRFLFNTILDYLSAEDEVGGSHHHDGGRADRHRYKLQRDSGVPAVGTDGSDRGYGGALRRGIGPCHAPQRPERAGLCEELRELRRQRPRRAVRGFGCEGAGFAAQPLSRRLRRHPGAGRADSAPSHSSEFPR